MITDNYTTEYQKANAKAKADRFFALLSNNKPHYNQVVTDEQDTVEISCDGAFKQKFPNIDKAIIYLINHQRQ